MTAIKEFAGGEHDLCVLDDLMHDVVESKTAELLFTQSCHHLSVVFFAQNVYVQGKSARTIALNCCFSKQKY